MKSLQSWYCNKSSNLLKTGRITVCIVLKAPKSVGAKGDVPKIYKFVHPLHPCSWHVKFSKIKTALDDLTPPNQHTQNVLRKF